MYSSNICEILLYNRASVDCYNVWANLLLFRLLTARGKIIVKRDCCIRQWAHILTSSPGMCLMLLTREAWLCVRTLANYSDVIMSTKAFQITGVSIVYSTICSSANQRKHQSSASLAFVRGIHRWPMNSPHKGSVTRKMFPFDDVIMQQACVWCCWPAKRVLCANAGVSNDCNHVVSNHKKLDCLFKSLFRPATKKTDHRSTLTALCGGESTGDQWITSETVNNTEKVSMSRRQQKLVISSVSLPSLEKQGNSKSRYSTNLF